MSEVKEKEVPGIIDAAITEAKKLADRKLYASAYDALANVARRINSWGSYKTLRKMFNRPGGSWDSMGYGCESWELARPTVDAAYRLKEAVKAIPRTGAMETYTDEDGIPAA